MGTCAGAAMAMLKVLHVLPCMPFPEQQPGCPAWPSAGSWPTRLRCCCHTWEARHTRCAAPLCMPLAPCCTRPLMGEMRDMRSWVCRQHSRAVQTAVTRLAA